MKRFALSVETTGVPVEDGHRIISVGVFELGKKHVTQNWFRAEYDPERPIDPVASKIHGYTNDNLCVNPTFKDDGHEFLDFIQGGELIIHKADFDIGFIDNEIQLNFPDEHLLVDRCLGVVDTLEWFSRLYPGERKSFDPICKKFGINANLYRDLPSAHYDARITAEIYYALKGVQGHNK